MTRMFSHLDERGIETLEWIVVAALIVAITVVVFPGTLIPNLTTAMNSIGATILGAAG